MAPPLTRSLTWADKGTRIFDRALASISDEELTGPTGLEGWTGRHLLAHVAANAVALGNLVAWARTAEETPMYSSTDQRNADIEAGATRSVGDLREWHAASDQTLRANMAALTDDQWQHPVRTAQGRTVAATEVPWMRAREVMVHAVDLGAGLTFADLPHGFLHDLIDDIVTKRTAAATGTGAEHPALWAHDDAGEHAWRIGEPEPNAPEVRGSAADLAAYLSGRVCATPPVTADGGPAPTLPRWL